jgi:diguanylate cyclase (GGDEF)-like protein/PAS domain S-box-containing protein
VATLGGRWVHSGRLVDPVVRAGLHLSLAAPTGLVAGAVYAAFGVTGGGWLQQVHLAAAVALGVVLVGPATTAWLRGRRFGWNGARHAEIGAVVAVTTATAVAPLIAPGAQGAEYLILPALVWAALRSNPQVTMAALASGLAAFAWHTASGRGGFAAGPHDHLSFQLYGLAVAPSAVLGLAVLGARRQDRDDLDRAVQELQISEQRFRIGFDLSPNGLAVVDHRGCFTWVNDAWCELAARPREAFIGQPWMTFVRPEDRAQVQALSGSLRSTNGLSPEFKIHRPDGSSRFVVGSVHALAPGDVQSETMVQLVDLTERRRIEDRLRASESRFRTLTASAPVGIFELDCEARCTYTNGLWHEQWDVPASEVLGHVWLRHVVDHDRDRIARAWAAFVAEPDALEIEFGIDVSLHGRRLVRARLTPLREGEDPDAPPERFVGTIEDVTTIREAQAELAHRASHDPLTELANRALLDCSLQEACTTEERLAMLVIDLDGFKEVNDGLGHAAGDRLLCHVANQLLRSVRRHDVVARLGGDEFAVLLRGLHSDQEAELIGNRMLEALSLPIEIEGTLVAVRGSIGVALADGSSEDAHGLLRDADAAMYAAKSAGKGRVVVFATELRQAAIERHELRVEFRRATFDGELRLVHQPVFDLQKGDLVGTEALLRWHHPQRGLVPPDQLINLAEESGDIGRLGHWIAARAIDEVSAWRRRHPGRHLDVAVNLSPRQLTDPALPSQLLGMLDRADLKPEALMVELVEGDLLGQVDGAVAALAALRDGGVRVALDDYGRGHASIGFLKDLPVDMLKLDHSLVAALDDDPEMGVAYVRSLLDVSGALRMKVVAEGIESLSQLEKLVELGCHLGQGYLLGAPVAIDDVLPAASLPQRARLARS